MIVEKNAGHIAFGFEAEEEFFELGDKVLKKQKIENQILGIRVQYNMRDRLLYDIEPYVSLEESINTLEKRDILNVLATFFRLILEVGSNGFVPIEAIQVGIDTIFWDEREKKAYFIVLPTAKECNIGDHRNWQKRMWDTLNELFVLLDSDIEKTISGKLSKNGNLKSNIEDILPILDKYILEINTVKDIPLQKSQKELKLIHDGKYGNFIFYIRKKEFVIGKRRDSVDGFLGVSDAVSRLHCKIVHHDDRYFVSDMGSSNHTFVNGTLIRKYEEKELVHGDKLRIADIDFMVNIVDSAKNSYMEDFSHGKFGRT